MFVYVIYFVLVLHIFLVPLYLYLTWNFNYWRKRGLTTAKPVTLLGSFPSIIMGDRNMVYEIHDLYMKYKRKNRAVGVFATRKPELLVLDTNLAHEILVKNFSKFRDPITSSWINDSSKDKYASRNPFWCAGELWKRQRNVAVAGLTQNRLKRAYLLWLNNCELLSKMLRKKVGAKEAIIETKDLAYRYTAEVMVDFIWGLDVATLKSFHKPSPFMKITDEWVLHTYKTRIYSLMATIAPIVRKLCPFTLFPKHTDEYFSRLTENAIKLRQEKPDPERPDFLNYLLQHEGLTHDDMVGLSLTVLIDGYETVGLALMHTLFYLAKYPQAQHKLREEIMQNMDSNCIFTYEDLMALPYLDQCVYETLRLITLLPNFQRICTEDTTIELYNGKLISIEKDIVVTIPAYSFHHDDDLFPEANVFRPERFDNGAHLELMKQGVFLPFSIGPRICIGQRLALMTIKAALVEILTEYEISPCKETPEEQNPNVKTFVLTLEGDVKLQYKCIASKFHEALDEMSGQREAAESSGELQSLFDTIC